MSRRKQKLIELPTDHLQRLYVLNHLFLIIIEMHNFADPDIGTFIRLTEKGMNAITNRKFWRLLDKRDTSVRTFESTMKTQRIQRIALLLSVGISVFTAGVAWMAYQKKTIINVIPPTAKTDTLRLHTTQPDTFLLYSH